MNPSSVVQLVVMGVSGSGKTTIAALLAKQLGCEMAEADAFHSPANIAKMSAAIPLEDADRWPWLRDIAAWIRERDRAGRSAVVTCSALKQAYRDVLRTASPRLFFIHLAGTREQIVDRVKRRTGHFMPASLVYSQFAILEPLTPAERGFTLDISSTPDALVETALEAFSSQESGS